jgi:hypothetical protein
MISESANGDEFPLQTDAPADNLSFLKRGRWRVGGRFNAIQGRREGIERFQRAYQWRASGALVFDLTSER